jgi:Arc/MetJ-type ribon-helix-helix transcriptional regulator
MSTNRKEEMITVRLDQELKAKMDEREEINWSGVARKAIRTTIEDLETMDEIAAQNQMTDEEAQEIADQITEAANERAQAAHEKDEDETSEGQVTTQ